MFESNSIILYIGIAVVVGIILVVVTRLFGQPRPIESSQPLLMDFSDLYLPIEDVFAIKGRGLVITGRIEWGAIQVGQEVAIQSQDGLVLHISTVTGIEQFRKKKDAAGAGENVGVLLSGLTRDDVQSGMIVTQARH